MINLSTFAPEDFKEHLIVLDNKARFNNARLECELSYTPSHQHYVLTGNEGVGKSDAVQEIFKRLACVSGLSNSIVVDAVSMYEPNIGFENALREACQHNTLIHIRNADYLYMKVNSNPKTGLDDLCNMLPQMDNSVVVLSGKRSRLLELIKGHEKAREYFTNVFHFDDLTPEAMLQYMMEYVNSQNYLFDPSTEKAFLFP